MPRPTSSTAIQRPDLGTLAYEYSLTAARQGMIADLIYPIFPVVDQSATYPIIPIEALLKLPDLKRSRRGGYNRDDWEFADGNYACVEYGKEEPVDDVEAKLYARFFDAEEVAVTRATQQLLRGREKRVADRVFNATTFASFTDNVTTEWSTADTCTPRADVLDAVESVRNNTGLTPDSAIMAWKVFQNVLICKDFKDHVQYTVPVLTLPFEAQKQLVAQYLGVNRILVGNAVYDSANPGLAATITDIWDDEYCMVAKLAENARDLREPCLGRTFMWIEDAPDLLVTEQYREEGIRCNIYRVRQHLAEAEVCIAAGYLLGNITA